jgi:hypothetical protein
LIICAYTGKEADLMDKSSGSCSFSSEVAEA